jgi:hypothetical protein
MCQVQELGFTGNYRRDDRFRMLIRAHMSLAFLPAAQISFAFIVLEREAIQLYPELVPFERYFRAQWIVSATTPPEMWCVHGHHVRRNNDLEGWHFAMTRTLPRSHPDIFTFIQWMIDEENISRGVAQQIDAGRRVNEGNRRYVAINTRIMAITRQFVEGDRSRGRFLKGCVTNLSELPQHNMAAAGDVAAHNGNNLEQAFDWHIFDRVEGVDFVQAPVWQPWV